MKKISFVVVGLALAVQAMAQYSDPYESRYSSEARRLQEAAERQQAIFAKEQHAREAKHHQEMLNIQRQQSRISVQYQYQQPQYQIQSYQYNTVPTYQTPPVQQYYPQYQPQYQPQPVPQAYSNYGSVAFSDHRLPSPSSYYQTHHQVAKTVMQRVGSDSMGKPTFYFSPMPTYPMKHVASGVSQPQYDGHRLRTQVFADARGVIYEWTESTSSN